MSRSGIMLCYPFDPRRLEKWATEYFIQPKFDGDRCRAVVTEERQVTLLSSECKVITSVPHINKALAKSAFPPGEYDGELYIHGTRHQDLRSIVSRTQNLHPDHDLVEYHIFDTVSDQPQQDRVEFLQTTPHEWPLVDVPTHLCSSLEKLEELYNLYTSEGYEGIILRKWGSQYIRKRSTEVMKFKPRREDNYLIIGVREEHDIWGKPKGRLGAFTCTGDGAESFDVGSGPILTAEGRAEYWKNPPVGKILNVRYQELFESGKPRFPVAYRIMEVKDLEQQEEIPSKV